MWNHLYLTSCQEKNELKPVSPIEAIKYDGLMFFSEKLDLENNLKMNLQSFDSKNEISEFIKNSFFDEYFEDLAESFNELIKQNTSQAELLVHRHAYLHPLPFGSCMREVAVHDCPKRLACQSGEQCGNFALTGRKGELDALEQSRNMLLTEFKNIESLITNDDSYIEMLELLNQKIVFLNGLKEKALKRQNNLTPIPIFPYSNQNSKLPITLSELFAIEQQKIEEKET